MDRLTLLEQHLQAAGLTLTIVTYRYADDHWDEAVRGAACIYVEKPTLTAAVDAWSVYLWDDGRMVLSAAMPDDVRAVLEAWKAAE
jgi:hypothetical protein